VLYATLKLFTQASLKIVWATSGATGLFIAALGTGLAHPEISRQYEYLTYPFIASIGILLAILAVAIGRPQQTRHQHPTATLQRVATLRPGAKRWGDVLQRWAKDTLLRLQSLWHVPWLKAIKHYQCIRNWQKLQGNVAGWSTTITLFVLLGLALALLAA